MRLFLTDYLFPLEHIFMRYFYLILYYFILRYLPSNSFVIKPIGRLCGRLRYWCCKNLFKHCGKGVGIERMASFGTGKDLIIGDRSNLGINSKVPSDICIGEDVMMGPNFCCYISNHKCDRTDIPMNQQGITPHVRLEIGNDVWIGCDVLLLPGGYIADGCVVAARSVITKRFSAFSVIGGVPAKVLRSRLQVK